MTAPEKNKIEIDPADLVPMDLFTEGFPVRIDLVYARERHPDNIFGKIYHDKARLWTHKDLAAITLLASNICHERYGLYFSLRDSLRTKEAQTLMQQADIVRRNPHWCEEPNRLLSPPGAGAHPRGMAMDLVLEDKDGGLIDMGTPFDYPLI